MTDVKKENREKFISIVESFALGKRTIREIGPIARDLSKIPFEEWDDVVENVTALAHKTKNNGEKDLFLEELYKEPHQREDNVDINLCFLGMGRVDPERRQAIVKQVLRLEFLTGAWKVLYVIDALNRLDVQDYDRVIDAALLLAPGRCPKEMVEVIAKAPKDIDELTRYALQNSKKMPRD